MSTATDARITGIHSLPTELLMQILVPICIDGDPQVPWKLTKVCSRWRQVLLASSSVWREIRIISDEWLDKKAYKRFLQHLELQLDRSGGKKLAVYLEIKSFPEEPKVLSTWLTRSKAFRPNLKQLCALLHRSAPFPSWKILHIASCSREMLDQMQLDQMGGFINLEILTLIDILDPLVPIVNATVTDSLTRVGYLTPYCPVDGLGFTQAFSNILPHVTHQLMLPGWFNGPASGLQLPSNISKLNLYSGVIPDANFPHIRSLTIQSAIRLAMAHIPIHFPNLKTLVLSSAVIPTAEPLPLIELPHLEQLKTHKLAYTLLNLFSAPRLRTLNVYLSGGKTVMPSWINDEVPHTKNLGDAADYLDLNLHPKEIAFLLPVSFPTIKWFLRCAREAKQLAVLFTHHEARTILSKMFRSMEGYFQERIGGEPEFWEISPHLEHLFLLLDCKMDDGQRFAWAQCASRFYASRSAETRLRQLDVIWSCREKRRAKV
ncbi:hypothetical protein FRC20_011054 [Serendipita sp. 405]|nr:hypothetical protein FRC20_011054 [Serendipita sp. 405]